MVIQSSGSQMNVPEGIRGMQKVLMVQSDDLLPIYFFSTKCQVSFAVKHTLFFLPPTLLHTCVELNVQTLNN